MSEWMRELLAAFGGGAVVLIVILLVFKVFICKYIESGVEATFEKSLEKFKNNINRSNRAFEMLLKKEMDFYEQIDPLIAELIPLEHDLLYYIEKDVDDKCEEKYESFKKSFKRYGEIAKDLKNKTLISHVYIPGEIFTAFSNVVIKMQDDLPHWYSNAQYFFRCEYEKIDYDNIKSMMEDFFKCLAFAEMKVKTRLKQMCGEAK